MRFGGSRYLSQSEVKGNQTCVIVLLVIFMIGLPLALIKNELTWREKNIVFQKVRQEVREGYSDGSPDLKGSLVHIVSDNINSKPISDAAFELNVKGALKLRRVTEYCQWTEHFHDSEDDDGHTIRTYTYLLGWNRIPILSAFYNEPFRHHNPLRDPYPSHEWVSDSATLVDGAYTLTRQLLSQVSGYQPFLFTFSDVGGQSHSESSVVHGFRPIGSGYFYSPYSETTSVLLTRLVGMFIEGSLDVQIGDFFTYCTAGDIRVSYEHVSPTVVSVVGLLLDDKGTLGMMAMPSGLEVGLLRVGTWTAQEMFEKDLFESWLIVLLCRVAGGGFWGLCVALFWGVDLLWSSLFWGLALNLVMYVLIHGLQNLVNAVVHNSLVGVVGLACCGFIFWKSYESLNHQKTA